MSSRPSRPLAPLIVEFVGTPGAGKTTVARQLVSLLSHQGLRAATPVEAARDHARRTRLGARVARLRPAPAREFLLWQLFYALGLVGAVAFARERRELVRAVVRGQMRRPIAAAIKRHMLFWFFQLGGRYRFLSKTGVPGEVLVVDDGFLHRTVALGTSHVENPDPAWIAWYVDRVPRPAVVVHVAAPVGACDARVRSRGVWPHFRHLSPEELTIYIANAEKSVSIAVSEARERGWTVVTIDNEDGARDGRAEGLDEVVKAVLAQARPASPPVQEAV